MTKDDKNYIEELPYPVMFTCVDMLIKGQNSLAMITKTSGSPLLRLPGGFVDTTDLTIMAAAKREAAEEIGYEPFMSVDWVDLEYNTLIQDVGRYNPDESKHRIRTHLFEASGTGNTALKAGDDAATAQWIPLSKFNDIDWVVKNVMPGHIPLIFWWIGNRDIKLV